ncbi:HEAT repeat domain-containing protein [Novosphingobium album (ex Liu et al. 2023)]|uniref:Lyase n=1 Tax=Novosphingobium album (ex Liu et al. 2023) TaxID=3031130 RepID=A0ABT5WVQ1_9SPHN|nr:HEAT repeat domain-containing protein [Novosphingobium album (ex Liu et al. 2023)]MDE8653924.1 lyase [Novosphingobium album (ex Liu et al. 2023)]
MAQPYEPSSDFLKAVIREIAPLDGNSLAAANFARLIAMTRNADPVNRDWATFFLAQHEADTPEVRAALLAAAEDACDDVRAEAIHGLAMRDPALALPLLRRELARDRASVPVFAAAALVADASLVELLREFIAPSGNALIDDAACAALEACERAARAASPAS